MIRTENILFLKKYFPSAWDKLRDLEYGDGASNVQAVPAKKGPLTLMIGEAASPAYLHSQYDPLNEAERFIRKFDDLSSYEHIFFYGVGLGYHVKALLECHPQASFSLYEPQPEIMYHWLSHDQLDEYAPQRLKYIFVETDDKDRKQFLINFANQIDGKVLLVVWPAYERLFKEEYQQFLSEFKEIVSDKRTAIRVNLAFEQRWTINSMLNLKQTLQTPNILHDVDKTYFKGKPAILVAAGPSLQYEFDNLKKIKEEGRAYIFSVGSAINALIERGILPDAACTYDPTVKNQVVFEKLKERQITNVPLIYGTSVGYETLDNYPGPLLHMVTSQDTISPYFLTPVQKSSLEFVRDASSIAVVILELLYRLGSNPVILVGQDLAYPNQQRYAEGIEYRHVSKKISDDEISEKRFLWVSDVHGKQVLSTKTFVRMRKQMENYIRIFSGLTVINTSRDGAQIEGATFEFLDQVIEKYLIQTNVVCEDWWVGQPNYSMDNLLERTKEIDAEYMKFETLKADIYQVLQYMQKDVQGNKVDRLERFFKRLEKTFKRLKRNQFYSILLKPILRSQLMLLSRNVSELRFEADLLSKGTMVVNSFLTFYHHLDKSLQIILPYYHQMRSDINKILGDQN